MVGPTRTFLFAKESPSMATIHVDASPRRRADLPERGQFVALPGESGGRSWASCRSTRPDHPHPSPALCGRRADNGEEEFVFVAGGILEDAAASRHGAGRHRHPRSRPRRGQGHRGQASQPRKRFAMPRTSSTRQRSRTRLIGLAAQIAALPSSAKASGPRPSPRPRSCDGTRQAQARSHQSSIKSAAKAAPSPLRRIRVAAAPTPCPC